MDGIYKMGQVVMVWMRWMGWGQDGWNGRDKMGLDKMDGISGMRWRWDGDGMNGVRRLGWVK